MIDKYATNTSTNAAGNGFCGANRYRRERTGTPVRLDSCTRGTRCVQGSIRLVRVDSVSKHILCVNKGVYIYGSPERAAMGIENDPVLRCVFQ